jgi:hypothetical protein
MSARRRTTFIATLALLVGAVPMAVAELALRLLDGSPPPTWGWRDPVARPDEQNQLGFRGQTVAYDADDLVVVLVGDSQVQADACALASMPERRLEHHLRACAPRPVKVFSLGAIGYGQDQELLALEDYLLRFRADAVVVWFTDGNDLTDNMMPTHQGGAPPKPTFWLTAEGELAGPSGRFGEPVYSRSRLLARLQRWRQGHLDDYWDKTHLPPPYRPMTSFDGEYSTASFISGKQWSEMERERTGLMLGFEPPSPRGRYAIALGNRLLLRMRDVAHASSARLFSMLVLRPDFPLADGVYAYTGADQQQRFVRFSRAQHWRSVDAVHEGVELIKVPVTTAPFCAPNDPHLNEAAVDQVMRDLATALARRLF